MLLTLGTVCDICGIDGAYEVHEAIVTRGDWPGHDDILTDTRNCLVVHQKCHRWAEQNKDKAACIIIMRETKERVIEFLQSLRGYNGREAKIQWIGGLECFTQKLTKR